MRILGTWWLVFIPKSTGCSSAQWRFQRFNLLKMDSFCWPSLNISLILEILFRMTLIPAFNHSSVCVLAVFSIAVKVNSLAWGKVLGLSSEVRLSDIGRTSSLVGSLLQKNHSSLSTTRVTATPLGPAGKYFKLEESPSNQPPTDRRSCLLNLLHRTYVRGVGKIIFDGFSCNGGTGVVSSTFSITCGFANTGDSFGEGGKEFRIPNWEQHSINAEECCLHLWMRPTLALVYRIEEQILG